MCSLRSLAAMKSINRQQRADADILRRAEPVEII
jgi:hypothetical protein